MKHIMIDIETLGLKVGVPLFEIGAVVFDPETGMKYSKAFWRVDLLDVILKTGFLPQGKAVEWWRKQEYDPTVIGANEVRVSLTSALNGLSSLYSSFDIEKTWGNSPSFDMSILEAHYEAVGLVVPWLYSQELDFRTVKWITRWMRGPGAVPGGDVSHNALDDALGQTEILLNMLRR